MLCVLWFFFFFQAEDGIRDLTVTGVQTCALPICLVHLRAGSAFPYGTLLINLTGCFFLGLIVQFTMNRIVLPPDWRIAITVGFFGGQPTLSPFLLRAPHNLAHGRWRRPPPHFAAGVGLGPG